MKYLIILFVIIYIIKFNNAATAPPSVLPKFRYTSDNSKIVITGSNFQISTVNFINIDGIDGTFYTGDVARNSQLYPGYQEFNVTAPLKGLISGNTYTLTVSYQGITSNELQFLYIEPIIMNTTSINSLGPPGNVAFSGSYSVSNKSLVNLKINNVDRNVVSIAPDLLTFEIEKLQPGTYGLVLTIGDWTFTSNIIYKESIPILDNIYSWKLVNGKYVMVFTGQNFSYYGPSSIYFNLIGQQTTTATFVSDHDQVNLLSNDYFETMPYGTLISTYIVAAGMPSNEVEFYYVGPISMQTTNLKTLENEATFSGSFSVSNVSLAKLKIDNQNCPIISISPSSIKFNYPYHKADQVGLLLNIGGVQYFGILNFTSVVPTLVKKYQWVEYNGEQVLQFIGTSLSYIRQNTLKINNQLFNVTNTPIKSGDIDLIKLSNLTAISNFNIGESLIVSIIVDQLESEEIEIVYLKSISITENDFYLNSTGGKITLSGQFGVTDINLVTGSINGKQITIELISKTEITFTYPSNDIGDENELLLNIGGLDYSTNVKYQETPTPQPTQTQSPTQSQPTPTPTQTNPNSNSDNSEDTPSISSKLQISFILSTFLLNLII